LATDFLRSMPPAGGARGEREGVRAIKTGRVFPITNSAKPAGRRKQLAAGIVHLGWPAVNAMV